MAHDQENRPGNGAGADADAEHDHDALQDCIEECINCHAVCTLTAQHCLVKGGAHADVALVGVLLDCAELCQVNTNFMLRGSPFHTLTCEACAELCRACEEACRGMADDEQVEHCADVCAACAESCTRMAAMGAEDDEDDEE